jgi:hypothetical protein
MSNTADPQPPSATTAGTSDPQLGEVAAAVRRLADARRLCGEYKAALDALLDTFYAEPHVQALLTMLREAQAARDQADHDLRAAMMTAYHTIGATRFGPAGEVRLMHEVVYQSSEAELLTFVKTRMPDVVVVTEGLDRRKLEKRLRTEPDTQIPGIVVRRTPKAFINADLGALLPPSATDTTYQGE